VAERRREHLLGVEVREGDRAPRQERQRIVIDVGVARRLALARLRDDVALLGAAGRRAQAARRQQQESTREAHRRASASAARKRSFSCFKPTVTRRLVDKFGNGRTITPCRSRASYTARPGRPTSTRTKLAWLGATFRPSRSSSAESRARSLLLCAALLATCA